MPYFYENQTLYIMIKRLKMLALMAMLLFVTVCVEAENISFLYADSNKNLGNNGPRREPAKAPFVAVLDEESRTIVLSNLPDVTPSYIIYNDGGDEVDSGELMVVDNGMAEINLYLLSEGEYSIIVDINGVMYEGRFGLMLMNTSVINDES